MGRHRLGRTSLWLSTVQGSRSVLFGLGLPLLALLLVASGCGGAVPKGERSCFSCDDRRLVRIVSSGEEGISGQNRRFDHPFTLDRKDWETVLRSVQVQNVRRPLLGSSYRGPAAQAFTDEEVRYLGEALQQAFQQATAQDLVVFALATTSEEGLLQLTSGAWLHDQAGIHLQLANYRVTVTMPSIRRQIWTDPLFAQAGVFYEPVPGAHQRLVKVPPQSGNPFRPTPAEIAIDYAALAGPTTAPAAGPSTAPVPPLVFPSLAERLEQLKHLYERGLITQEDYRMKKQQLLDRL